MYLNTAQTVALAAELSVMAVALCAMIAALISQDGPARRGRHAAPPTPPPSTPTADPDPEPGPRRLAADWREQITLPPDPVLVRPYVTYPGTAVAR